MKQSDGKLGSPGALLINEFLVCSCRFSRVHTAPLQCHLIEKTLESLSWP